MQFFPMYTLSVQYTKVAEVCVLIDNIGKGYFLTGHSEKGCPFQDVERTAKSNFCSPLFPHRYIVDQQSPLPLGHFLLIPTQKQRHGSKVPVRTVNTQLMFSANIRNKYENYI